MLPNSDVSSAHDDEETQADDGGERQHAAAEQISPPATTSGSDGSSQRLNPSPPQAPAVRPTSARNSSIERSRRIREIQARIMNLEVNHAALENKNSQQKTETETLLSILQAENLESQKHLHNQPFLPSGSPDSLKRRTRPDLNSLTRHTRSALG